MSRGRKLAPLVLTDEAREQFGDWAQSTSMPAGLALRARIVLARAEGLTSTAVARRLGISLSTVGKWRSRFLERGVRGLHDKARPGRPRTHGDDKVAMVISRALQARPSGSGSWSVRRLAEAKGVSKSTVQRWFSLSGVEPRATEARKLSGATFLGENLRGITGLYLYPPDHAVVLSVDGKTRIQVLARTQPAQPTALGRAEGCMHDYIRHGTTTLGAALDLATGKGVAPGRERHGDQEWLAFLQLVDRHTPAGLGLHLVRDSCVTHEHAGTRVWLAHRQWHSDRHS